MSNALGWLHLSDIHFLDKLDWRNSLVLDKLQKDLSRLREQGLGIDLVFCTGDIGYGETSKEPLADQYATAKRFFDEVLVTCGLKNDRLFLVPGNHDIDRGKVLVSQTEYFRNSARTSDEINQLFRDYRGELQRAMERLEQYRLFVKTNYAHIPLDDKATFATSLNINGVTISIAGLNSAWTCADNEDKGELWLAGETQLHTFQQTIKVPYGGNRADLRIALLHHPTSWIKDSEAKILRGRMQNEFDFLLHGHEHDQWVQENRTPNHTVIAAGAAAAGSDAEFGYNLVQLSPGRANVHLRRYDRKGDGWVEEIIAGRTENGMWSISPPSAFASPDQPVFSPSGSTEVQPTHGAESRGRFGLDEILDRCAACLVTEPLLVIYGLAGVGKSVIVDELHQLPSWRSLKHLTVTVQENTGLHDFFSQLAPYLGIHDERPRPPVGNNGAEIAEDLRRIAPHAIPFFLHVQRAHLWFKNGQWLDTSIAHMFAGLARVYPDSVIILETREKPSLAALTSVEANGLTEAALTAYMAHPPHPGATGWSLNRDQRRYIFQRLGGGHGRGAHAYGLFLLVQLAAAKNVLPNQILKQFAEDYAEELYEKLFRDLYENVLEKGERCLLFACSLYRNGLHYSHLARLEEDLPAHQAGEILVRRRLLTEDADWLYLHDLAAEQARKLEGNKATIRSLHTLLAGYMLDDLRGQRHVIEANIRRALEAFYHLEQAGEGERVFEIAPELFWRRSDETVGALWRLEEHFMKMKQHDKVRITLEYLLKVAPDEHKAMRFIGESYVRKEGKSSLVALKYFQRACELRPDFAQYWANLGNISANLGGDHAQSYLNQLDAAISVHPEAENDVVALQRSFCLDSLGRHDAASQIRMNVIRGGSRHLNIYISEASNRKRSRDLEGALEIIDLTKKTRMLRLANARTPCGNYSRVGG